MAATIPLARTLRVRGALAGVASPRASTSTSTSSLRVSIAPPPPAARLFTTRRLRVHDAQPSPLSGARLGRIAPTTSDRALLRRWFWTSPSSHGEDAGASDGSGAGSSSSTSPPPRPTIRQRIRFLFKRYGWWAFAVYNLWSLVDFSLTWAVIHWAGADYIRQLESSVRDAIGMRQREHTDVEVAQWPLNGQTPAILEGVTSPPSGHANNEGAAREAAETLTRGVSDAEAKLRHVAGAKPSSSSSSSSSSTLWAEAVLAYTIHKTLLLPFRVMGTGAVTPSFVKYMVRMGWAKPLPPIAAGGAATAATVGKATNAVASKGVQEAAKGGLGQAVKK